MIRPEHADRCTRLAHSNRGKALPTAKHGPTSLENRSMAMARPLQHVASGLCLMHDALPSVLTVKISGWLGHSAEHGIGASERRAACLRPLHTAILWHVLRR